EIRYEAYGPGGVAMLIDTLTNNRNRTVAEVRAALTKAGGSMGETGSVAWVFEQKGVIAIDLGPDTDADSIALAAIDAGAEDVEVDDGLVEVLTQPSALEAIRATLESGGVSIGSAEVMMRPGNSVGLEEDKARSLMKLIDALEDLDDVQRVYSNADFPDSVLVEA
ncbi:MAG: YebC/PmpR family DNA-binding transcriptional regulator, partial [Dehalococcoidia bacterium]